MLKRVVTIATVGLAAVLAAPTLAMGQKEQGSTETPSKTSEPATEPVSEETSTETQTEVAVEEESTEESDTGSNEIEPQTAPAGDSSTGTGTTASTASSTTASSTTTATQSSLGTAWKPGSKKKKASASRKKKCSTSSRAGGPLASAAAPPAPGCDRIEGSSGTLELADGTVIEVEPAGDGTIQWTVIATDDGSFTLIVKGGPDPGEPCDVDGAVVGQTGTCSAPLNPNSGKLYGVSHVDLCPRTPGAQPTQPEEGRRERDEEREREKAAARRKKQAATVAAAETVAAQGEQLPFTGLPVAWMLILGVALLSGGLAIRRKA